MKQIKSSEILKESKEFLVENYKVLLIVWVILLWIPSIYFSFQPTDFSWFVWWSFSENFFKYLQVSQEFTLNSLDDQIAYGRFIIWMILMQLFTQLFIIQKEKWTYQSVWWVAVEILWKIWKLIVTNIVQVLWLMVLFLLLIIPWIIYSIFWYFSIFTVLYYWVRGRGALQKSKSIVQWRWWETIINLIVYGILFVVIYCIVMAIYVLIYQQLWWVRNPVIDIISNLWFAIVLIVYYTVFTTLFLSWKQTYELKVANLDKSKTISESNDEED